MTRLSLVVVLLLSAFYVAWPAYTGHRIARALDASDAATLERNIDFPSVRASMRPAVAARMDEVLKGTLKSQGSGGALLLDQVRKDLLPKLVDGALDTLVTPQSLIRLHAEGRSLKEAVDGTVRDRPELAQSVAELIGGLLGRNIPGIGRPPQTAGSTTDAAKTPPAPAPQKRALGPGNIKSIAFDGPLAFTLGLARDPQARDADVTATFSFTGSDWKLTGLVPRL